MNSRRKIEAWIDRLIALLDELDGDADFEPAADDEPDYRDNVLPDGLGYLATLSDREDWPPRTMAPARRARPRKPLVIASDGTFTGPDGHRYIGRPIH